MNANEIPANVTFTEYTGETDWRNNVETINVNGVEYGIRVRRMHGLNPARDGEYYVIYMPDEAKAEQLEAALKAAGHKATPDECGVIVRTWAAFMAGVEMLNQEQPAPEFSELSHAATIARRIEAMRPRGAWKNGVKQYALMLLDWYETEANESPLTLETMLNGAKDWQQYARGGAGVAQCYNARIAETLCSPSELKRNNHGAKMPNRFEDWQDIESCALFQAWRLITEAETLVNCNA